MPTTHYNINIRFIEYRIIELKLWKPKLIGTNNIPKTRIDAVKFNIDIFPNVMFIFKILGTLPISTSTPKKMIFGLK